MSSKTLRSFARESWVIPNGSGQLWTDKAFDTKAEAKAYVEREWAAIGLTGRKHRPVKAIIRLSAKLGPSGQEIQNAAPTLSEAGGQSDG